MEKVKSKSSKNSTRGRFTVLNASYSCAIRPTLTKMISASTERTLKWGRNNSIHRIKPRDHKEKRKITKPTLHKSSIKFWPLSFLQARRCHQFHPNHIILPSNNRQSTPAAILAQTRPMSLRKIWGMLSSTKSNNPKDTVARGSIPTATSAATTARATSNWTVL